MIIDQDKIKAALFGVAIGDALGVPAEFKSRLALQSNPVTGMGGYESHNQPPGTFSDDSSLTFCLAESLCKGYDLNDIAQKFIRWRSEGYWTANGKVFDIGIATNQAIARLKQGVRPDLAGNFDEDSNGNGSLMRILPLLFYVHALEIRKRYKIIKEVSSITHAHIRSVIACFYYLELARNILNGLGKFTAYKNAGATVSEYIFSEEITNKEIDLFAPLLKDDISLRKRETIYSSGYVLHTLQAATWCLLTTNNYRDAVLTAVNLGEDTDTTAAVTGGLAGLFYGYSAIPQEWIGALHKKDDIAQLCDNLDHVYGTERKRQE